MDIMTDEKTPQGAEQDASEEFSSLFDDGQPSFTDGRRPVPQPAPGEVNRFAYLQAALTAPTAADELMAGVKTGDGPLALLERIAVAAERTADAAEQIALNTKLETIGRRAQQYIAEDTAMALLATQGK